MKTIEERAEEFALKNFDGRDIIKESILELRESAVEYGYIQGATDQRNIDIKKASEWFKRNAEKFFEVSIKYGDTSIELSRKFFDDFRKAMEE